MSYQAVRLSKNAQSPDIKQVFYSHVGRRPHGPSGIRLHPGIPGGGRERAGHPAPHPHRPRAQGRPHLHRRGFGPEHAPPRVDDTPGDAPARRRRRGPADRPPGPEPDRGAQDHRGAARPGHPHPRPGGGPGHRGRQSHLPPHAAHAALPGRVGEGEQPGPDQGRRRPHRLRGEDLGQAPGAGTPRSSGPSGTSWRTAARSARPPGRSG